MDSFVVVSGNIGVGKTSLTRLLARENGWTVFFEPHEGNPFLEDFYQDMTRWGFHSQVFFLSQRLKQHHAISQELGGVIQDRSIYEDAEIFARNLANQGRLPKREYATYTDLYQNIKAVLPAPDLVVYLQADVKELLSRISKRGRSYEKALSSEYLEQLAVLYEDWVSGFTLCPVLEIDTSQLDFVRNPNHATEINKRVLSALRATD